MWVAGGLVPQAALGLCSLALGPRPSPFAPFTPFHLHVYCCVDADNFRVAWWPVLFRPLLGPPAPCPLAAASGLLVHRSALAFTCTLGLTESHLRPARRAHPDVAPQTHAVPSKGIFQLGCGCPAAEEVFF